VLLVGLTLLPLLLFRDRLPDPLATHWDLQGRPNGNMGLGFLVLFQLLFAGLPAWLLARLIRRRSDHREAIFRACGTLTFIAAMTAIVAWIIVAANLDAPVWSAAAPVGFAGIGLALATAAVVGVVAGRLASSLGTAALPAESLPSAGLAPGSHAIWSGSARSRWAWPIFLGLVGFGLNQLLQSAIAPGLLLIVLASVALPFTSIRVLADRNGLSIAYGPAGWPRQQIPLSAIRAARAITVRPLKHGGWGYRGSLRLFRRAAVVLRGGEGLALDLADGKRFVVTVDDAERGAGVINDLLAAPA
jgi:hypothetical protein